MFNTYDAVTNTTFDGNTMSNSGLLTDLCANMTGVEINGNTLSNVSAAYGPGAILVDTYIGQAVSGLDIENNTITGAGGSGIELLADGGDPTVNDATIQNVTISGNSISSTANYGIDVDTTASGNNRNVVISNVTIENNTLTDNTYSPIFIYSRPTSGSNTVSGVTITGNTIASHAAVLTQGTFNLIDLRNVSGTNTVSNNTVTISGTLPAATTAVRAIGIRGSQTGTIDITGNTLNGGGVASNGPTTIPVTGVLIQSNDPTAGALTAAATIDLTNNLITGFENGITVRDTTGAGSYGNLASGVQVNVNTNSIAGNSLYGLQSGSTGATINASDNWWGSANGPTTPLNTYASSGTGDTVSGNVNVVSWYTSGDHTSQTPGWYPAAALDTTAPTVSAPSDQSAGEGAAATINLGSFTDADGSAWHAVIAWGDGGTADFYPSAAGSLGTLSHTYAEESTGAGYAVTVTVIDQAGNSASAGFHVGVTDPAVLPTALNFSAVTGVAFTNVPVATFTDPGGPEAVANYSATINWGDNTTSDVTWNGSAWVGGGISVSGSTFTVAGNHTYSSVGTYPITVTIHHETAPDATTANTANATVASTVWVNDNWQGTLTSGQIVTAPAGEGAPSGTVFTYGVNAFSTIQAGINAVNSGGAVEVLPGSYTETVTVGVGKAGVTLAGYGTTAPTVTVPTTASYAAVISVAAANVTISGLNIVVDQPYASAGVAAVSGASGANVFGGLQVLNNTIVSQGTTPWGHGLANPFGSSYSVGIAALANGSGAIPTVTIQGNQVLTGTGGSLPGGVSAFMRGIWLNQVQGAIGGSTAALGNNVAGYVQDALVAFSRGATTIQNNAFDFAGVTITEPNGYAPIGVTSNAFSSAAVPDDALLLVKHDYNATSPVTIQGNTFAVPSNSIGILSAASIGVSVSGNLFAPVAGAANTVDIDVDTFQPTGTQDAPYYSNTISITGNTFNGATGASNATAIQFADHNAGAASPSADFGAITVGGSGVLANAFSVSLQQFIVLAPSSSSVSFSGDGYSTPHAGNVNVGIDASQNIFGVSSGDPAGSLTLGDYYEIEGKITDGLDYSGAGLVSLSSGIVYVAQSSETYSAGAIQRAVNLAGSGNIVDVQAGTYTNAGGITVSQSVTLLARKPTRTPTPAAAHLSAARRIRLSNRSSPRPA